MFFYDCIVGYDGSLLYCKIWWLISILWDMGFIGVLQNMVAHWYPVGLVAHWVY
jgi:hypothetical protein